jgi:hypothetical protein
VYHYHIDTGAVHDPLTRGTRMHCPKPLDAAAMRAAAALLVGVHDFTQLSNESRERLRRNPVRELRRLDVLDAAGGGLRLEVEGSGFLYKQARGLGGRRGRRCGWQGLAAAAPRACAGQCKVGGALRARGRPGGMRAGRCGELWWALAGCDPRTDRHPQPAPRPARLEGPAHGRRAGGRGPGQDGARRRGAPPGDRQQRGARRARANLVNAHLGAPRPGR